MTTKVLKLSFIHPQYKENKKQNVLLHGDS